MRRVAVVGCGGAGKSTFARELARRTGLPVVHLDKYFWHPGWVMTPSDKWRERHRELLCGDRWIADGNYGSTQDERFARADTIVFFDFARWRCQVGIHRRWIRHYGRSRPDLAADCPERFDWEFTKFVWHFNRRDRPELLERLERFREGRRIVTLRNRRDVRRFLETVDSTA